MEKDVKMSVSILLLFLVFVSTSFAFPSSRTQFEICRKRILANSTNILKEIQVPSQIECARACNSERKCLSANVVHQPSGYLCQLYSNMATDCESLSEDQDCDVILPVCIHGGKWNEISSQCENCDFGFAGTRCERHIIDCAEGQSLGLVGIHQVLIQPINAVKPFLAACNFNWAVTYVAQRGELYKCGSFENFNRGWEEYKSGFGNTNCEYFIGLDNLHLLTSQRSTRLKIVSKEAFVRAIYWNFVIDSEKNRYVLRYDSFSTEGSYYGGDGFSLGSPTASVRNSSFCTFDQDCGSCALDSGSGWWFNTACSKINLHVPLGGSQFLEWVNSTMDNTTVILPSVRFIIFP